MKFLLAIFLLVGQAKATDITFGKKTYITIGGSIVDSSKLSTSGGIVSGAVSFSSGPTSPVQGSISASTDVAGGIQLTAVPGSLGAGVINLFAPGSDTIAVLLSTGTDPSNSAGIVYNGTTGEFSVGGKAGSGTVALKPGEALVIVEGGTSNVQVLPAQVNVNGPLHLPTVTSGFALCINGSGQVKTCTSVVSAGGACTCP